MADRQLATTYDVIIVGMGPAGAVAAAAKLAEELDEAVMVCIICDRGDRYLSSGVFGK